MKCFQISPNGFFRRVEEKDGLRSFLKRWRMNETVTNPLIPRGLALNLRLSEDHYTYFTTELRFKMR